MAERGNAYAGPEIQVTPPVFRHQIRALAADKGDVRAGKGGKQYGKHGNHLSVMGAEGLLIGRSWLFCYPRQGKAGALGPRESCGQALVGRARRLCVPIPALRYLVAQRR